MNVWIPMTLSLCYLAWELYRWSWGCGFLPNPREWWQMRKLGYGWKRFLYEYEYVDSTAERDQVRLVAMRSDGLWYGQAFDYTHEPWHSRQWESDVGFTTPVAAHIHAEVEQWPAR